MFLEEFKHFLEDSLPVKHELISVGDFNLHFDVPSNSDVQKLLTLLSDFSRTQNIHEPTHRCGHILDWLTNKEGSPRFVHNVRVQDSQPSDHKAAFSKFPLRRPRRPQRTVTSWNVKLTNTSELTADTTTVFQCPAPTR